MTGNTSAPGWDPGAQNEGHRAGDACLNSTAPGGETPALSEAAREAFLALVPVELRNPLAQFHYGAAHRYGAKTPTEVAVFARRAVQQRAFASWGAPERREAWRQVLVTLTERKPEWRAFCEYIVAFSQLPRAAQEQIKAGRGEAYRRAAVAARPVTDAQRRLLSDLGITDVPENRQAASDAINAALAARRGGRR